MLIVISSAFLVSQVQVVSHEPFSVMIRHEGREMLIRIIAENTFPGLQARLGMKLGAEPAASPVRGQNRAVFPGGEDGGTCVRTGDDLVVVGEMKAGL